MFEIQERIVYVDSRNAIHTTKQDAIYAEYNYLCKDFDEEIQTHVYNRVTGFWEDQPLSIETLLVAGIIWIGTDEAGLAFDKLTERMYTRKEMDPTTVGWYLVTPEKELRSAKTFLRNPAKRQEFRQLQFLDEHAPQLLKKPPPKMD